jgi:cell division protein FtsL
MKAYVLVGFIVLAIVVLGMISRKQREHLSVPDINQRLTNMENKIAESDKKQRESEGEINSTLR